MRRLRRLSTWARLRLRRQPFTLPLAPFSRQSFQLAQGLIGDVSHRGVSGVVGRLIGHSSRSNGGPEIVSNRLTKRSARVAASSHDEIETASRAGLVKVFLDLLVERIIALVVLLTCLNGQTRRDARVGVGRIAGGSISRHGHQPVEHQLADRKRLVLSISVRPPDGSSDQDRLLRQPLKRPTGKVLPGFLDSRSAGGGQKRFGSLSAHCAGAKDADQSLKHRRLGRVISVRQHGSERAFNGHAVRFVRGNALSLQCDWLTNLCRSSPSASRLQICVSKQTRNFGELPITPHRSPPHKPNATTLARRRPMRRSRQSIVAPSPQGMPRHDREAETGARRPADDRKAGPVSLEHRRIG